MAWPPTYARRWIKALDSGSDVVVAETDAGRAYLKGLGNRSGPHALARDWVGTQLAAWIGLPTFDLALLRITAEDELPFLRGGKMRPGPAIAARAEETGHQWSGAADDLKLLANPTDLARLVVFDTWIRNHDRQPPEGFTWKANRDNVFLSREGVAKGRFRLKAIDHSHCFDLAADLSSRLARIDCVQDERIYGLFPEFLPFLRPEQGPAPAQQASARDALDHLGRISASELAGIVGGIPREWEVDTPTRAALVQFLAQRATFLHDRLFDSLFPQPNLPLS